MNIKWLLDLSFVQTLKKPEEGTRQRRYLIACWDKPGGTQSEFNKDTVDCKKDCRQSG
jgi:hypothetical protein